MLITEHSTDVLGRRDEGRKKKLHAKTTRPGLSGFLLRQQAVLKVAITMPGGG